MVNQLKMAQVHAIQALRNRDWSQRRIARELGIHRETVARYLRLARAGPPKALLSPGLEAPGHGGGRPAGIHLVNPPVVPHVLAQIPRVKGRLGLVALELSRSGIGVRAEVHVVGIGDAAGRRL